MNYSLTYKQLEKNFYDDLSNHYCIVTALMKLEQAIIEDEFSNNPVGMRNFSKAVFDLNIRRISFHNSLFNDKLKYPSICLSLDDEMRFLKELTEPSNLIFCMDTLCKSYKYLKTLTKEESKNFNIVYIRRLLEKDDLYHPYLHYMHPCQWDAQGNVRLISIQTKRLQDMNVPEFRFIGVPSELFPEEHAYSRYLQDVRLKDTDIKLLEKYLEAYKKKGLSEVLNKSRHTISNKYTRLNTLFKVDSMQTSSLIYYIMQLHNTGAGVCV
ncbi:MAG: hypothetical protein P4L34_07270 [Paludibacter sp.]|nr:hypothetical protein [Paludibacter sp.]